MGIYIYNLSIYLYIHVTSCYTYIYIYTLYYIILYCIVLYCIVLCYVMLYYIILYITLYNDHDHCKCCCCSFPSLLRPSDCRTFGDVTLRTGGLHRRSAGGKAHGHGRAAGGRRWGDPLAPDDGGVRAGFTQKDPSGVRGLQTAMFGLSNLLFSSLNNVLALELTWQLDGQKEKLLFGDEPGHGIQFHAYVRWSVGRFS